MLIYVQCTKYYVLWTMYSYDVLIGVLIDRLACRQMMAFVFGQVVLSLGQSSRKRDNYSERMQLINEQMEQANRENREGSPGFGRHMYLVRYIPNWIQ